MQMNKVTHFKNIIIGAGPAGLFAAAHIESGTTLLLEKNQHPGQKLLISGSGQCNFTHIGPAKEFLKRYGDNYYFLEKALTLFCNSRTMSFFKEQGIETVIDKNGKVFPASLKADDILQALLHECYRRNVKIHLGEVVSSVKNVNRFFHITSNQNNYTCENLIIATGGKSYPSTGSSGDGYQFAKALRHSVVEPRPALCPIIVKDYPFAALAGISIKMPLLQLFREKRLIRTYTGDIGFTHKGLSGPGIIDFSRYMMDGDLLKVNLIHLKKNDFNEAFLNFAQKNGKLPIISFFKQTGIARNLILALLDFGQIPPDKPLAETSKTQRTKLAELFCEFPFIIERLAGFKAAMATVGGIDLSQINPETMESNLVKNLFFAGEVMDIDGDTGGYNIQAAFSTGFLTAQTINGSNLE